VVPPNLALFQTKVIMSGFLACLPTNLPYRAQTFQDRCIIDIDT
jgi:hypothetical protein